MEKIDFILHGTRELEIYQDSGHAHIWCVLLGHLVTYQREALFMGLAVLSLESLPHNV